MFLQLHEREEKERRLALAKKLLQAAEHPKPKIIPPRLVITAPRPPAIASESPQPARGVYRERVSPPGEQWFKIVLSSGKIGLVYLPDELVDDALVENLWQRLERRDPILKII